MAIQTRWEAAVAAGEVRVTILGGSLKGLKAAMERNELGPSDFYRRVADRLDSENAELDSLFLQNQPPLDGHMEERARYRAGQDRIRARLTLDISLMP